MSNSGSTVRNEATANTTRPTPLRRNVVAIDIPDAEESSVPVEATSPAATARLTDMIEAFRAIWPAYQTQPESDRVIDDIVAGDGDASLSAAIRAAPEPTPAKLDDETSEG